MRSDPQAWKSSYDRDGYVVVEDCVDAKMLDRLRAGIEWITRDPDSLPEHLRRHIDFERSVVQRSPHYNEFTSDQVGNAIRNIMELPLFNPLFAELICYEPVLDVLEALFQTSEFAFHNYKCIIKAPKISSRFGWHRDLPYLQHSTPNLLTAMICLDEMTEKNGATVVMPGTHRVRHEDVPASDTDIPEEKLPRDVSRVMVSCPAGSLVVFHVNIIHGGPPNRSDAPRRNVIGIWSGPDAYPVNPFRYVYQGMMPRSKDPARQKQVRMTFPNLFK